MSEKKGKGEEDRSVLLVLGRDDLLLLAYLHSSAVPSDIDMPIWRKRVSLRVRPTNPSGVRRAPWGYKDTYTI